MNLATGRLLSSCAQLLWPAHCAGCDALMPGDDAVFCGPCAQSVNPLGMACAGCGLPRMVNPARSGSGQPPRCSGCVRREFAFSRAYAGFEYGAAIASAIVRMKHGRPDLARRLGRILQDAMLRALVSSGSAPVDGIVPVPLHPRKLRHRGFNQALELARAALARLVRQADRGGRPADTIAIPAPLPTLHRRLLLRVRPTRELGRSGPGARRVEVFGAFGLSQPALVMGRRFLVVDDVMTTGATLNECAETLLRGGAADVRVVALARAL